MSNVMVKVRERIFSVVVNQRTLMFLTSADAESDFSLKWKDTGA